MVSLEKKKEEDRADEESVRHACAFMIMKINRYLGDICAASYPQPPESMPSFMYFAETLTLTNKLLSGTTPEELLEEVRNAKNATPTIHNTSTSTH